MTDRLTSAVLVSAMMRRVNDAGGSAMVLAKGDPHSGVILVVALEKGVNSKLYERGYGPSGAPELVRSGPQDSENESEIAAYWARRKARDPDLWVIELDIAFAERFAAETIIGD